jgi:hypothetical protein
MKPIKQVIILGLIGMTTNTLSAADSNPKEDDLI